MRGFSLIELMVVVSIVAILTAIAVPTYKSYTIRTKIMSSIQIMERVAKDLQREFSVNGSYPASITFNGVTITSPSWQIVDFANIKSFSYAVSGDGLAVTLGVNLTGLEGIPNYVSPTVAAPGDDDYSGLLYAFRDFSGVTKFACGQLLSSTNGSWWIPFEYLPSACQCNNVNVFRTNGSACT